jgi:hypothetical protein
MQVALADGQELADTVEKVGHLSAAAGRRIWPIAACLLMRP